MKSTLFALAFVLPSFSALATGNEAPCAFPESTYRLDLVSVQDLETSRTYTPGEVKGLDRVLKAQIVAATSSADLAAAIEAIARSEDRTVGVRRVSSALMPSAYYTIVTYYPGGNEYGAIFTTRNATPAAQIQDGDITDCRVFRSSVAHELSSVPTVDGSDPAFADLVGLEEFVGLEQLGSVQDAELAWSLAARAKIAGLNALQLKQLAKARRAIEHVGGPYGEAISAGRYLEDADTRWELYTGASPVTGKSYDLVHFSESDDGSYTVVFHTGSTKLAYIYYEN